LPPHLQKKKKAIAWGTVGYRGALGQRLRWCGMAKLKTPGLMPGAWVCCGLPYKLLAMDVATKSTEHRSPVPFGCYMKPLSHADAPGRAIDNVLGVR
jgi:hypothetical protein